MNSPILGCGSSPRGRGTRQRDLPERDAQRIIPARAGNTFWNKAAARFGPDHPRAGGEHLPSVKAPSFPCGSSPRGRGTRLAAVSRLSRRRIIPARAGNTGRQPRPYQLATDHPRAGGEHQCRAVNTLWPIGSSPRGRGTQARMELFNEDRRIIPARAGNTCWRTTAPTGSSDHPRAGGEHRAPGGSVYSPIGSSPRGRGTQSRIGGDFLRRRIIPARAGNTKDREPAHMEATDHPRAGGEHQICAGHFDFPSGSSPRGRGTRTLLTLHLKHRRIIPARAGNTIATESATPRPTDHPRAGGEHGHAAAVRSFPDRIIPARAGNTSPSPGCGSAWADHPRAGGEHLRPIRRDFSQTGSSPRGRGTLPVHDAGPLARRIIPARAGNTRASAKRAARGSDHPRAGGEHTRATTRRPPPTGSSPRGRGTQSDHCTGQVRRRIIPARAGNTASTISVSAASAPP